MPRATALAPLSTATDLDRLGDEIAALSAHLDAATARLLTLLHEFEDGVDVSAETSRRLACDATRVVLRHAGSGQVLDVGRRTRTIPPALRRALEARDRGCRFPGCGVRHAQGHHLHHWANGGPVHRAQGLAIGARTGCPSWLGERLDLGWAIGVLHPASQLAGPRPASG